MTVLPGLSDDTLLRLIGEAGTDPFGFAQDRLWLCLTPRQAPSGQHTRPRAAGPRRAPPKSRAWPRAPARPPAGLPIPFLLLGGHSQHLALGGFSQRIRGRVSAAVANVATARKLGVLFYNLLRSGVDDVARGLAHYTRADQAAHRATTQPHRQKNSASSPAQSKAQAHEFIGTEAKNL